MTPRPRVLILGAGALGGLFGARLVAGGAAVQFLLRAPRAARIVRDGLRVHFHDGEFSQPVEVVTAATAPADLVLLSCKAWDLDAAIAAITPAIGADSFVLPLLNGLRHLEQLDAAFGRERVLGGLAHVSATLLDDDSIRQFGALERLVCGARDARHPLPAALVRTLRCMRSEIIVSDDILGAMWEKFTLITALAGGTCLLRAAVGAINAVPGGTALLERLYAECLAVAEADGHPPRPAARDATRALLGARGSPLKASMLRDLERGARTEAEPILGDMYRRARDQGIDTPLLGAALVHLRVHEAARVAQHGD